MAILIGGLRLGTPDAIDSEAICNTAADMITGTGCDRLHEKKVIRQLLAALTLILGAAYTLWMYKRVVFGDVANENVARLEDVSGREKLILAALAAVVLLFGLWPAPLLEVMEPSVGSLLDHVMQSKLP